MSALLVQTLRDELGATSDEAVARHLDMYQTQISKIRNKKMPVGPAIILTIHRKLGWPVARIDALIRGVAA